jgi:hypothetical protein
VRPYDATVSRKISYATETIQLDAAQKSVVFTRPFLFPSSVLSHPREEKFPLTAGPYDGTLTFTVPQSFRGLVITAALTATGSTGARLICAQFTIPFK